MSRRAMNRFMADLQAALGVIAVAAMFSIMFVGYAFGFMTLRESLLSCVICLGVMWNGVKALEKRP